MYGSVGLSSSLPPPVNAPSAEAWNGKEGGPYSKATSVLFDPDLPELPKAENGSMVTAMQVCNTMIGSGIFAFPSVLAKCGVLLTTVLTLGFGSLVVGSSLMLVTAGKQVGVMDFSLLVQKVLGYRARQLSDFFLFAGCCGALMSYMNVIGSLGSLFMDQCFPRLDIWINTYPGFMIVFTIIFCLPFGMLRSYGELAIISGLSSFFIVCTLIFMAIDGGAERSGGGRYSLRLWPTNAQDVFGSLGSIAYATSCQYVVFESRHSMTKAERPYFPACLWAAGMLGCTYLLTMATLGYTLFGPGVSSNVMLSFNQKDWKSLVGYFLVVMHLLFYIPNDFIMMRHYFFKVWGHNVRQMPTFQYVTATVTLFAIPVSVMASIPKKDVAGYFSLVLNLTGSLPSSVNGFLIPGVIGCILFSDDGNWRTIYYFALLTTAMGVILTVFVSGLEVVQFIEACQRPGGCSSY